MNKLSTMMLLAGATNADFDRGVLKSLKPRRGPTVSAGRCGTAVTNLKAGPANIPAVLEQFETDNRKYNDPIFKPESSAIYWDAFTDSYSASSYQASLDYESWYFRRSTEQLPEDDLFDEFDDPTYTEPVQGNIGDCYIIASMSAIAEWPDLIKEAFVTQEKNAAGIYGVNFYIRGKPWTITVDDYLLFSGYSNPSLVFGAANNGVLWPAILEKAWAKMKGNYHLISGGFVANGLKSLTGAPVFYFMTGEWGSLTDDEVFELISEGEELDYPMGAGTEGSTDTTFNDCGIAMGHAYAILNAFTMTDADDVEYKMYTLRNPWGITQYSNSWSSDDSNWTEDLVDQVPYGIDPRTSQNEGIFVIPHDEFQDCLGDFQIAAHRRDEGYLDTWYDIDEGYQYNDTYNIFSVDIPANNGDLYFSVDTYYQGIVPELCQTGEYQGYVYPYNIMYYDVFSDTFERTTQYYLDQLSYPIVVPDDEYDTTGETFSIGISPVWFNGNADLTIKVYAKGDLEVVNSAGNSRMLHMDGKQPSGFTTSIYCSEDDESLCPEEPFIPDEPEEPEPEEPEEEEEEDEEDASQDMDDFPDYDEEGWGPGEGRAIYENLVEQFDFWKDEIKTNNIDPASNECWFEFLGYAICTKYFEKEGTF